MADHEYVPGAGDVEIELEGKKLRLKPSLEACLRLSRSPLGDPRALYDKCMGLNFEAMITVIAAGLGVEIEEIQESVFRTGTANLIGPCSRFIINVSNGGRAAVEEAKESEIPLAT